MTVRDYLKQAFTLQKLINAKKSRIQDLRDMQYWVGSTIPDVKVQTSPKPDRICNITAMLMDAEAECLKDIARLVEVQREIESLINSLERPAHRYILYERYVNLKCWDEIAEDSGYNLRHVYKLHGGALSKIQDGIVWHSLDVV